ncbi:hypothetical protein WL88_29200 [Burkholderia diffusa]|uniref:Uncharacterized protein n=1 Tax=Burkholderia diffusa TaxID=488732 RepID=A0AAW3PB10_9BURK|nr:hypothetical protein WI71_13845 [Burkholderia diffusa]KWF41421.1 hypothetical protein WL85_00395 [Burkholderia diffusa]KWF44246.1 hypothetical protein WL86_08830 [Burkholderia diffusa]KWF45155.1 hypothetical protein WL88_29200 [Burkholderia diffusa]KWF51138.1 hypothetical protein WL87_14845 [Burkholderia diffusa]
MSSVGAQVRSVAGVASQEGGDMDMKAAICRIGVSSSPAATAVMRPGFADDRYGTRRRDIALPPVTPVP